ncbi:MAG TPA: aromatic ring-hydroxylating dioxygenase subunit alpha [Ramlibacter sp.]|uniref:aromatic ring-hydroxylating oxygenase subunit alpha n=1 Tax=Ramlibacter sp. TaxID=1917967 RepID=UPI002BDD7F89|nr:aromatic ring-hydroxylating dioxygenase subunit alpha [Ramlibacter sp.]HVZ45805.1 aromatic ring-hydroxylating dioxygenase subunit alpha [Ramlibacter sp.]
MDAARKLIDATEDTYRVSRACFTDADIYRAERDSIFNTCWLYLGHGSELAKPGSFVTRSVGGRHLLFNRDAQGEFHAFFNTCPHRGATVCRERAGNAKNFTCAYHGWVFAADGKLRNVPGIETYCQGFADDPKHNLVPVARLEQYRDFWFVCYDRDAISLVDYLAGSAEYLDLLADQSEAGMEIVGGTQEYQINANWKLLVENSIDGYHAPTTHSTYLDYLRDANGPSGIMPGIGKALDLGNGHAVIEYLAAWGRPVAHWTPSLGEDRKPELDAVMRKLVQRHGPERAERIAQSNFNMLIFPNLIVLDIMSVSLRTFYPCSPDQMEVTGWALGPSEESESLRATRLDNFLEFIGPGGFATPDDVEMLEHCQRGYANARETGWNDISKGMARDAPMSHKDERQIRVFWQQWRKYVEDRAHP